MVRSSQAFVKTKLLTVIVPLIVIGAGIIGALSSYHAVPKASITTQQAKTTDVKYHGVDGRSALSLLQQYAKVDVKHYSFGDFVVAINGAPGNGPKYWSFYVNGKLSDVGAGSYTTHNSDAIEWKLQ